MRQKPMLLLQVKRIKFFFRNICFSILLGIFKKFVLILRKTVHARVAVGCGMILMISSNLPQNTPQNENTKKKRAKKKEKFNLRYFLSVNLFSFFLLHEMWEYAERTADEWARAKETKRSISSGKCFSINFQRDLYFL